MISITTRNLTRRFGKVTAVENLNLKVSAGALFGLIGPNGAGKTTTLRMLAGLLEPSSGEFRINELTARQYWRDIRWQIGFMPDFFGVYENLLVWEYLDFFARCYKLSPARRQQVTDELMELVDLSDKRDAFVHTLSRGMRQRLCLAHALVHDPQVLLLDEPASGLDPRGRVEMRELLRELQAMGKTILLSSHILNELAELCDSVGIMDKGHLIASGSLEEIRKRLTGNRKLRLCILSDPSQVKAILQNQSSVHKVYPLVENGETRYLEFEFTGDESAAADLLEILLNQGTRVASLSEVSTNLEDIFLQITTREAV